MDGHLHGSLLDGDDLEEPASPEEPLLPDYGGACLSELVPTLLARRELAEQGRLPAWLPAPLVEAEQVVLVVLDGLGWAQLQARAELAPTLSSMDGGAITSVAPTTTATALTSVTTGTPPAEHGIVGYRLLAGGEVLNVLRWSTSRGDARELLPPGRLRRVEPFLGSAPPVVTRAEFAGSGFTEAHLHGVPLVGWRMPSSIRVEVERLVREGAPFVYAYYDGVDKIAHETGLGEHYAAELCTVDRLVSDLLSDLPEGCALAVTADHGQVEVRRKAIELPPELLEGISRFSGEGRFRWLHCEPGAAEALAERCRERYGHLAWVRTREELVDEGWLGGRPPPQVLERLGQVALVPFAPVAFFDPSDTGELRLVARHGSLTADEVLVPLVAWAP